MFKTVNSITFKNKNPSDTNMDKRGSHTRAFLYLLIAFMILFSTATLLAYTKSDDAITGRSISINSHNTIRVPDSNQPMPNENEGTIVLWTKPPIEIFEQFDDARDYIIFYSATNVPGLRIVYNIQTKRFEAGTPQLKSPEIDIFDGNNHQLVYTFNKEQGQAIYLDGVKVDESTFKPLKISQVTGFAIALPTIHQVDIKGVEVAVYDRYTGEENLDDI